MIIDYAHSIHGVYLSRLSCSRLLCYLQIAKWFLAVALVP